MNKIYMSVCLLASMITVSTQAQLLQIYHEAGNVDMKEQSQGIKGYTLRSKGAQSSCPLDTRTVGKSLPQSSKSAGKIVTPIAFHDSGSICQYEYIEFTMNNGDTKKVIFQGTDAGDRQIVTIRDDGSTYVLLNPFK
jgi:hypothetical protein